jgi:replication-associated recombination protein RarA
MTWQRPIPHHSLDPWTTRTTVHGLPSDEVRSALQKHIRRGRAEQAVLCAIELARTDVAHDELLWSRLAAIAAEDVGMGAPEAAVVIVALRQGAATAEAGSVDRLLFASQAAGYLARCPKDPVHSELLQVALLEDLVPEIPDEARCVHTRAGQEAGRTMYDWFLTGTAVEPEVPARDTSWRDQLLELYGRLDPPTPP